MNNQSNYYAEELYNYYKDCLGEAINRYRSFEPHEPAKAALWIQYAKRCACLTDLYQSINKQFKRG